MTTQLMQHAVIAGRFRLNHPIGRGGMGSVWHATHLGLDIPCAVKFIEGQYAPMAEAQARFEREAKAAAMLRSPNVVQILDHGVHEGTPYIAMELLEGEDLGKRLERTGKLSPRETYTIVMQVCRALSKAHALGIVHRDLKPDNIFLVRDDDREIAKVLDFGIAKQDQSSLQGSNTKTGAMLGTPYYMSPEQAQGTKSVDFRSDLWSLGVIVYQCLTGTLPFESEALGDLLVKIIVNPLPVPSQFAIVPPGFDSWWARAAARDPAGRFQSAKDFADAFGLVCGIADREEIHVATGSGVGHLPSGVATTGSRGERPLSATTGGSMAQTYTHPDDPATLPRKRPPIGLIAGVMGIITVVVIGTVLFTGKNQRAPAMGLSSPTLGETSASAALPPNEPSLALPASARSSALSGAAAAPATSVSIAPPVPAAAPEESHSIASASGSKPPRTNKAGSPSKSSTPLSNSVSKPPTVKSDLGF